jgi:hypothetical protein
MRDVQAALEHCVTAGESRSPSPGNLAAVEVSHARAIVF